MSEIGLPAALPAAPDDIDLKKQDAARAVRMRLAGPDSTATGHTMASAARAIRNALRGIQ